MTKKHIFLVFTFVFLTSIVWSLLLAGIEFLTGFGSTFLLMLIAVYIGNYLIKNLEYYKMSHKILAASIAFLAFWMNVIAVTFLSIMTNLDVAITQALIYTFSIDGFLVSVGRLQLFDYLIMVVMPIITYQYLSRRSAF